MDPTGEDPQGNLAIAGNTLFGATGAFGTYDGAIFSSPATPGPENPEGWPLDEPTILTTFNGADGDDPVGGVILIGNTLYGTTASGGAYNDGTVFSLPISGGAPDILVSFNGADGGNPTGTLIADASGNLYGTTAGGGANGAGEVFTIQLAGGAPTILTSFDSTNGAAPESGLLLIGTTLYGTTALGGASGDGVVFSLPTSGGTPTILATFNGANGADPQGALVADSSGNLFGTTSAGGIDGLGTVFELPSGTAPVISSFAVNGGAAQRSIVTQATVTFNQPVNLAAGAISLMQRATGGGSPTPITFVQSTTDNTTWILNFPGYTGASLPDGIFDLTITAADVTSVSSPTLAMSGGNQTFTFDRLFGDIDGNGVVNNADYFQFKKAFGQLAGSANYNAAFDYDANGVINNADYFQFKQRFGQQIIIPAQNSDSFDAGLLSVDSSSNNKIAAQVLQS
jgi:uncharacterized repeat protein (TIGR03803 family)